MFSISAAVQGERLDMARALERPQPTLDTRRAEALADVRAAEEQLEHALLSGTNTQPARAALAQLRAQLDALDQVLGDRAHADEQQAAERLAERAGELAAQAHAPIAALLDRFPLLPLPIETAAHVRSTSR